MIITIIGTGLMGPAAAYQVLCDPSVTEVRLLDIDPEALERAQSQLASIARDDRVKTVRVDLSDRAAAIEAIRGSDAAMSALPWSASLWAISAALAAGVPIVDLAIPEEKDFAALRTHAEQSGGLVLLGCGLEPGLTEIMSRYLAESLDAVDELHIKVGGVPSEPVGPLGYRIVFGGRRLPLRQIPALVVTGGLPVQMPRYSGLESVEFAGSGTFEAWHEGVLSWIPDMEEFAHAREITQKTLRWPGYAEKATVLNDLGLLDTEAVDVDGVSVIPKHLVDTVLYPHVRLRENETDLTLFRVELVGERAGLRYNLCADMVDRMDRERGFTSMARTTAFTGAIAALMIARGEIGAIGVYTAEQLVLPSLFKKMMKQLAASGIKFVITEELL